ncbi:MAG: HDIG domain-containing protein [Anaerolineae bacterium]|nr:HDIG domain-containing protein [Anaerolineae bacterium]
MSKQRAQSNIRRNVQILLFGLLSALGIAFILSSDLLLSPQVTLQEGQAASEDIVAPYPIEFRSAVQTEIERNLVSSAVLPVYDPLDRQIGREQVSLALQILSFIDSVRADVYATPDYRQYCLEQIDLVKLSSQVISDTLSLAEADWQSVQLETRQVLDEIMRREIKTGQEDARRREVRMLIDFQLTEQQTAIVDEIASALVKANRTFNPEKTELARQAAMDGVQPVIRSLAENEMIVRSGEIVTAEDIEVLDALGLRNPSQNWFAVSGAVLFSCSLSIAMTVYIAYNEPRIRDQTEHLLLLLLLLLLFVFLAKWGVGLPTFQPFVVPLGTLAMLVTVLLNVRVGLVTHLIICLLVGYMVQDRLDLLWYHLVGGLVGIFATRRVRRINTFVWAGGFVTLGNVFTSLTFLLLEGEFDTLKFGQLALAGIINGGLTAILTFGGYYLLGIVFQITTSLQLMDLARPTHPLMRDLLLKAPGTYHHSIMVGNMAEQAAEAIGADALLARVGAFYHDIGKTMRPYFFTENQMDRSNPHDLLDAQTSAQIVRSHTVEGLELARKHRLPRVLQAFISEHHGTAKISYFYHKAVQEYGEENVNDEDYRHVGPRPQSKETAIVMLADTCEAAVRSVHPENAQELEKLIRKLISNKIASEQLNNVPLTLREIEIITLSFIDTLQGVFHPRISYPNTESGGAKEQNDTGSDSSPDQGPGTS